MDRLNEDDLVLVTIPGHATSAPRFPLECHVLAIAGRTVALEAVHKAATLRLPEVTSGVYLTFRHGNSLVGLKGTLLTDQLPGDLRFLCPEKEGRPRSRPTRADVITPVTLRRLDAQLGSEGVTINMSFGGLLAECDAPFALDDEVEITLRGGLRGSTRTEAIELHGSVRRAGQGLVAVEFDHESAKRHSFELGALVIQERRAARIRTLAPRVAAQNPATRVDF